MTGDVFRLKEIRHSDYHNFQSKGSTKKNDSKILPRIEEQNSHIYIKRKFESVKIFDLGVFVGVNFYELIFEMNNDYES